MKHLLGIFLWICLWIFLWIFGGVWEDFLVIFWRFLGNVLLNGGVLDCFGSKKPGQYKGSEFLFGGNDSVLKFVLRFQ